MKVTAFAVTPERMSSLVETQELASILFIYFPNSSLGKVRLYVSLGTDGLIKPE